MFCYYDKVSKLGYYPIHKNGSTTFSAMAKQLNWETTEDMELLPAEYKIFAHIRNPIDRHFAGTAEYILTHNLKHTVEHPTLCKLWTSSLMDVHSYPITWVLGDIAKRIHWIPITEGFDTTKATIEFLNKHSINISEIQKLHEINEGSEVIRKKLMALHPTNDVTASLTYFYEHDFKLYYQALDEYLYRKSKYQHLEN